MYLAVLFKKWNFICAFNSFFEKKHILNKILFFQKRYNHLILSYLEMKTSNFIFKFFLITVLFSNFSQVFAQYKIELKINNYKNSEVQFAYYYADNQYIVASEKTDANGKIIFSGKEKLARGLYLFILGGKTFFDVLISDDQEFAIETDTVFMVKNMKIKGSQENEIFYEFQKEILEPVEKRGKLSVRMYELPENSDSVEIIKNQIELLNQITDKAWKKYVEKSGESFLKNLLTAFNSEPEFTYSKDVFFEHIQFADSGLVRSPVLNRVCKLVLARNLNANLPMTLFKADVIRLLEKSQANSEVFAYVFTHFLNFFHSFQREGINELFVFLYDDYIATGKVNWFKDQAKEQIKNEADLYRNSMIGSKAHPLDLEGLSGEHFALQSLDFEHIFVLFWSTGCGHCEEAMKALRDFTNENKTLDLAIYSVYTKEDRKAWSDFVEQNGSLDWINVWDAKNESMYKQNYYVVSTPILYVLDRKMKIVNKFSGDEPIKMYLNQIRQN